MSTSTIAKIFEVTVAPKENAVYNPLHDNINGKRCCYLNFEIGYRGLFHVNGYGDISTSPVINIVNTVEEDKTVTIETKNTFYIFELIEE